MTPDEAVKHVERLYTLLAARSSRVNKCERYFSGEHSLAYATKEWREFNGERYANFSDNWCAVVASSPAERIRLTGIRIGSDSDVVSDDERLLMDDWNRNEMDAQSSQGFLHTIVTSTSAVIVWADPDGNPVVDWERADQVYVDYWPGSRRRRMALKSWTEGDVECATLYTDSEVWKFERSAGSAAVRTKNQEVNYDKNFPGAPPPAPFSKPSDWVPRLVEDESWPLPHGFGIAPVVEVPNRPQLGADPISDIAGVIPMQDAINLMWAYLFASADFASMPARVVMGQEPPKVPVLDKDGKVVGEEPVDIEKLKQGRLLWLTGENTSIGQWEAARLDIFTDVINRMVRHVAAQTRTPVHYIVGELNNINGETLVAGETGLVKKVEEFHLFAGGAMREVFRLMALCRGNLAVADAIGTGTVLWANAQTYTQAQASDAALKDRQVGFPFEEVARKRYGYTPTEIAQLVEMRQAEEERAATGDMMAAFGPPPNGQ